MLHSSRTTGCLTCGNDHGRFDSVEHIIPAALGNTESSGLVERELTIPKGETCTKCNGKRLSRIDRALVEWPPISVFRSLGLIRKRRGGLADAVTGTAWRLDMDESDRRNFSLHVEADTSPTSRRDDVARALCKIALETRWLEDPNDARSARWDPIANAATGGELPNDLAMGLVQPGSPFDVDLTPDADVLATPNDTPLRLGCRVEVVGLALLLIIGTPPARMPRTQWWTIDDPGRSLEGPDLMWARFDGRADSATPLSAPSETPASKRIVLPTTAGAHLQITPGAARDS
jgi:hypothetical protein